MDIADEIAQEEGLDTLQMVPDKIETPEPTPNEFEEEEPEKPAEEPVEPAVEPDEFVSKFNENFGTSLKEKADLDFYKERVKNISKYEADIKTTKDRLSIIERENQELKDLYDPSKIFVNETEAKRQQLLKKFPEYDPSHLTKVMSADLEKISPQRLIILKELLENGDVFKSEADVIDWYENENSIDLKVEDINDLGSADKTKVLLKAKEAKKLFNKLRENANAEEADILSKIKAEKDKKGEYINNLKKSWLTQTPALADEIEDLSIVVKENDTEDTFTYKLGDEFRSGIRKISDKIAAQAAERGLELTEENKKMLKTDFREYFIKANFDKIVSSFISDGIARYVEREAERKKNPKPSKTQTPPAKQTLAEVEWDKTQNALLEDLGGY